MLHQVSWEMSCSQQWQLEQAPIAVTATVSQRSQRWMQGACLPLPILKLKKKKNPQFNLFSRSYFYFLMGGRWSHLAFIPNPSGGYVRYKPQRENTVAVRGCEGQAPLGSLAPRPCTEVHGRKAALNEKGLWTLLFCRQRRTIQGWVPNTFLWPGALSHFPHCERWQLALMLHFSLFTAKRHKEQFSLSRKGFLKFVLT